MSNPNTIRLYPQKESGRTPIILKGSALAREVGYFALRARRGACRERHSLFDLLSILVV